MRTFGQAETSRRNIESNVVCACHTNPKTGDDESVGDCGIEIGANSVCRCIVSLLYMLFLLLLRLRMPVVVP
jgi:hypothetical protein